MKSSFVTGSQRCTGGWPCSDREGGGHDQILICVCDIFHLKEVRK